jgi:hypothetical protein
MTPDEIFALLAFRAPNYLQSLSEPGMANKVNSILGMLAVEGIGKGKDAAVMAGSAALAPPTGGLSMAAYPATNLATDYAMSKTIDPMILSMMANSNFAQSHLGLNNNPNPLDTGISNVTKKLHQYHPMTLMHNFAGPVGQAIGNYGKDVIETADDTITGGPKDLRTPMPPMQFMGRLNQLINPIGNYYEPKARQAATNYVKSHKVTGNNGSVSKEQLRAIGMQQ